MSAAQTKPKKTGGWGSLLSGAVAGLESRLDTILADDEHASAKQRTAEEEARKARAAQRQAALKEQASSRASSRNRGNERLQSRLARALEKGSDGQRQDSQPPSEQVSQAVSPSISSAASPRPSTDVRDTERPLEEPTIAQLGIPLENGESKENPLVDKMQPLPPLSAPIIIEPQPSMEVMHIPAVLSGRSSQESPRPSMDSFPIRPISQHEAPTLSRDAAFLECEIARATKEHEERILGYQSELHAHLERIDALQSKLAYLAQQASVAAKAEAQDAEPGSLKKKLAEKDEKIALLLEEGKKLSENEVKALGTVRTLRTRLQDEEKAKTEWRRKFEAAEREVSDYAERARRAEQQEREATERLKVIPNLEQEVAAAQAERDVANHTIAELRKQLAESERRADNAEKRAQTDKVEEQIKVIAELNDELSNARIEKRLVEDRARSEIRDIREEAARQQEKSKLTELELKGEIQNLESKLEVLRAQSETLSSSAPSSAQTALLRQVETLQTQYALATENWEVLETSLNARITALEKDRDDIAKRESDVRKKAREVNSRARKLEDELELVKERADALEAEKDELQASMAKLEARLRAAEKAASDAKSEFERERKALEETLQARLDEEKIKWRLEIASQQNSSVPPSEAGLTSQFLRTDSPTSLFPVRKSSAGDFQGSHTRRNPSTSGMRAFSVDLPTLATLSTDNIRPTSRRAPPSSSTGPIAYTAPFRTATDPAMPSRQDSTVSIPQTNGSLPPTANISVGEEAADRDETGSSPQRTVNDLFSVSTAGAGPSVQLVERMSAAVRRLESEKAASKEELARLTAQRDEARGEAVRLMRDLDNATKDRARIAALEKELQDVRARYDTTLEMLGEKSEEVEELQNDVLDLKKIYRELVESTLK